MTVKESGTRTLATYTYDRLSRRSTVTYDNGTSAAYDYTRRGDLTDLDWTFTGETLQYDYVHDNVGQMTSETISNALYEWSPGTTTEDLYAAAFNANGAGEMDMQGKRGLEETVFAAHAGGFEPYPLS